MILRPQRSTLFPYNDALPILKKKMNTLGAKLLQLRHHWRLAVEELAAHLGVAKTAVSKCEADKSISSLENTIIICNYFEIPIDYFVRGVQGLCSLKDEAIHKSKYLTIDSKIIETLITNQEEIIKLSKK